MNDIGIGYRPSGKGAGSGRTFVRMTDAGKETMRVDEVSP